MLRVYPNRYMTEKPIFIIFIKKIGLDSNILDIL
jgi:hypothetical protein